MLGCFKNINSFKAGSSDFFKLTHTVLKQYFPKQKPKVIIHSQFKIACNDYFRTQLGNALLKSELNNIDYGSCIKTFPIVLGKHIPLK